MSSEDKSGGRPPVVTDEALQKLKQAFLLGCTDKEACLYSDISPRTLYNYQRENEEFLQQKETWKLNPFLKARTTLFENLDKVDVAKWFMEKRNSSEFGDDKALKVPEPYHEPLRLS